MSEETKKLKEKLFNEKKDGWEELSEDKLSEIMKFSDEYMYYLNNKVRLR